MRADGRRAFLVVAVALALGSALTQAGTNLDVPGAFRIQGVINEFIQQRLEASRAAQERRESDSRDRWQQINARHQGDMDLLQQEEEQAQNQQEARRIQQQQLALQYQQIKAGLVSESGVDYTSYTPVQLKQLRQEYLELQQNKPVSATYDSATSLGTVFRNSGVYLGYLDKSGRPAGQGMYWWNNQDFFVGEFNGYQYVSGTLVQPPGKVAQGHFSDKHYLEGPGCVVLNDGGIELGHFKDGLLNGPGVYKYTNGTEIIGTFAFGSPTTDHVYIDNERAVKPTNYTVDGNKIIFKYDFGDGKAFTSWNGSPAQ